MAPSGFLRTEVPLTLRLLQRKERRDDATTDLAQHEL